MTSFFQRSQGSPRERFPRRAKGKSAAKKEGAKPSLRAYPTVPTGRLVPAPERFQWELLIAGELTDKQADLHDRLLDVPRCSRGILYFDSCGGSAYIGLALASLIRLRGLRATAVVVGECSSAAILPLAACAERYVTAHSVLLFHPTRWQSEEQVRLEEAVEWARHFEVMEADHEELTAKLFGCPAELIHSWSRPGRFVMGTEFADTGLARLITLDRELWSQIDR